MRIPLILGCLHLPLALIPGAASRPLRVSAASPFLVPAVLYMIQPRQLATERQAVRGCAAESA